MILVRSVKHCDDLLSSTAHSASSYVGARAFVGASQEMHTGEHTRLPEMKTDLEDPLTLSTWIESTPGYYFSVNFTCDTASCFIRLLIDGKQQKKMASATRRTNVLVFRANWTE